MLSGTWALGRIFVLKFERLAPSSETSLASQSGLIGALVLAIALFPMALIGLLNRIVAQTFACLLLTLGIVSIVSHILSLRAWFSEWKTKSVSKPLTFCCVALLLGYFVLALGPINEADSLDYHVGVALKMLNTGAFPAEPGWFHSRLAGAGEVLIALGLALGAEQFGALLQWVGLLSVVNLLLKVRVVSLPSPHFGSPDRRGWWILLLLATPIYLAWIPSAKPMILPGAMTTLALYLTHQLLEKRSGEPFQQAWIYSCLIFCLALTAANMKFNFHLSAGLIIALALYAQYKGGRLRTTIFVLAGSLLVVYFPFISWKWSNFGGSPIEIITSPLAGEWPGTENFENYLRSYRDSTLFFPLSLVVPNGLGNITTVFGVGLPLLLVALLRRNVWKTEFFVIALLTAGLGSLLGQGNSRFYLEPFYWGLIAVVIYMRPRGAQTGAVLVQRVLIGIQGVGVGVAIVFGIVTISLGSLKGEWRQKVMKLTANDYSVMYWLDSVLPKEAVILSDLRSTALIPRQAYSNDARSFIAVTHPKRSIYFPKMTAFSVPLYLVTAEESPTSIPSRCVGPLVAGPFEGMSATRNPWNRGVNNRVWIYEIGHSCLFEEQAP